MDNKWQREKEKLEHELRNLMQEWSKKEDEWIMSPEPSPTPLDGPMPPELEALYKEYKQKFHDILRRHHEVTEKEAQDKV